jgi:hypothetical protein
LNLHFQKNDPQRPAMLGVIFLSWLAFRGPDRNCHHFVIQRVPGGGAEASIFLFRFDTRFQSPEITGPILMQVPVL